MTMELKIISPDDGAFPKAIEFNYDELKGGIEKAMEKYDGLAYTDDTIQDAKDDRATLNKFADALDTRRKEIKAKCLEPYAEFEKKIKELISMVAKPKQAIDAQVKAYDDRKKKEKQNQIQAFWDAQDSHVKTLVSLDRIFNPRWLNVTFSMTKIEKEIIETLEKIELELDTIEALDPEFKTQVTDVYMRDFSLANALAEDKRLREQKARQEEYRRQQEAAKAEATPESEPAPAAPITKPDPGPATTTAQAQTKEPVLTANFRVEATATQLMALRQFMNANGITFSRIENRQAA